MSDTAISLGRPKSPALELFGLLIRRKTALLGLIVLAIILAAGIFAPFLAPYDPQKLAVIDRLQPPNPAHWLGTDELGRDVLSRLMYGGQLSLFVGFSVVVFAAILGILLGLLAGYFRAADVAVSRFVDAMMAFPDILLAIALVAALPPSIFNVIIALGIVYTPRIARVVRASTLVIRELPFVEAATVIGVGTPRILVVHVLRNLLSPLLVQGTFIFAYAILAEAGMSFLGVGVSGKIPTWGGMISAGQQYIGTADWMMVFPGLAIVFAVASLQLVGDGLRDVLDPRLRKLL